MASELYDDVCSGNPRRLWAGVQIDSVNSAKEWPSQEVFSPSELAHSQSADWSRHTLARKNVKGP